MSLKTMAAADVDLAYTDWGISATYTPKTGSAVACLILQDHSKSAIDTYMMSDGRIAVIRVRKSEVPAVAAKQDKMTIGASTWGVEDIIDGELDPLEWVLAISKDV